jgi:hypothetical protein
MLGKVFAKGLQTQTTPSTVVTEMGVKAMEFEVGTLGDDKEEHLRHRRKEDQGDLAFRKGSAVGSTIATMPLGKEAPLEGSGEERRLPAASAPVACSVGPQMAGLDQRLATSRSVG